MSMSGFTGSLWLLVGVQMAHRNRSEQGGGGRKAARDGWCSKGLSGPLTQGKVKEGQEGVPERGGPTAAMMIP